MVAGSSGRWGERVKCPVKDCAHSSRRNNMGTHLLSTHKWDRDKAWATAKELPGTPMPASPSKLERARTAIAREAEVNGTTLAPVNYEGQMVQLVDCPQGCGAVTKRKRLYQHLEAVHKIEHRAALRLGREAQVSESTVTRIGTRTHGRPPARNKPTGMRVLTPHKGTQSVDFADIDPAEIAVAVVQSQVNGTIQTSLLPDVILYVDHTRELVGKLRAAG